MSKSLPKKPKYLTAESLYFKQDFKSSNNIQENDDNNKIDIIEKNKILFFKYILAIYAHDTCKLESIKKDLMKTIWTFLLK